jgi:hypothetical protein
LAAIFAGDVMTSPRQLHHPASDWVRNCPALELASAALRRSSPSSHQSYCRSALLRLAKADISSLSEMLEHNDRDLNAVGVIGAQQSWLSLG